MGVAGGDLDGDGQIDVAVTNYYNESTSFFRNLGQGYFGEQSSAIGLAAPSRYVLGFGIAMPDVDNDGWLDLMTANGHIHDGRPQFPWKMPVQLYHNEGTSRRMLEEVSSRSGEPFQALHMGRGLAAGDVDNDGRIDALIVSQNEPLVYLHNRSHAGHFLTLRLEGKASNRDAVGARVTVRCGKRLAVAQRSGGGSYLSAGDPRLHFGLGAARQADRLRRTLAVGTCRSIQEPRGRCRLSAPRGRPGGSAIARPSGFQVMSPRTGKRRAGLDRPARVLYDWLGAHVGSHREFTPPKPPFVRGGRGAFLRSPPLTKERGGSAGVTNAIVKCWSPSGPVGRNPASVRPAQPALLQRMDTYEVIGEVGVQRLHS